MKNIRNYNGIFFLMFIIVLLPSCGRIIDWTARTFTQVPSLDTSRAIAAEYLRSMIAYDQFTTRANFDVLWLADDVRMAYVDLVTLKFGKSDEQRKVLLRRQLEENNHFISFYILSLYECPLGEQNSEWAIFLTINDINYVPIEVKAVDLSPEYIFFFGKRFNAFKVAYSIKFDARTIEDQPLITKDTDKLTLILRSVEKEVKFVWDINEQQSNSPKGEEI